MKQSFLPNCDLLCLLHFQTYILIFTLFEEREMEFLKIRTVGDFVNFHYF